MASQSSQAVVRSSQAIGHPTDRDLMPPPTKRIKRPPKVIDEDTYTDALSKIIARDFFPGLVESQTQQEYLDALQSQDREWIDSAGRKLTNLMTPGQSRGRRGTSLARSTRPLTTDTPRGDVGETPVSVVSSRTETTTTSTQPLDLDNIGLGTFQAKYTSEDNESFYKLLDKQNKKRAEKYVWLWSGNKIASARQILHRERERKLLAEKAVGGKDEQQKLIEGPDERKAMPDTWDAKPDNQVFFAPDGIEDEMETVQQRAEAQSKAPPKAVAYDNTRLPPPPSEPDPAIPPSPSISAIQDAIAGRPRPSVSEVDLSGGSTPRVNGYAFVDDEPTPSELGHHEIPISFAGSGDSTPNPFKIREPRKRESLHHRMVDRVAKRNRAAARPATRSISSTPTFPSSPRVGSAGNLTPAAQRLWSRVGTPSIKGSSPFGGRVRPGIKQRESSLGIRWTPTPKARKENKE